MVIFVWIGGNLEVLVQIYGRLTVLISQTKVLSSLYANTLGKFLILVLPTPQRKICFPLISDFFSLKDIHFRSRLFISLQSTLGLFSSLAFDKEVWCVDLVFV